MPDSSTGRRLGRRLRGKQGRRTRSKGANSLGKISNARTANISNLLLDADGRDLLANGNARRFEGEKTANKSNLQESHFTDRD